MAREPTPTARYFFNTHRQVVQGIFRLPGTGQTGSRGKRVFRTLAPFAEARVTPQGEPDPQWSHAQRDAFLNPLWLAMDAQVAAEALEVRIAERVEDLARERLADHEMGPRRRSSAWMFRKRQLGTGLIYVVDIGGSRKVGVTQQASIWRRISQYEHSHGPGVSVRLRAVWQVKDAGNVEQEVHEALEPYRIRGEWYAAVDAVLDTTARILSSHGAERGRGKDIR